MTKKLYNKILYSDHSVKKIKTILRAHEFNNLSFKEKTNISNEIKKLSLLSNYDPLVDSKAIKDLGISEFDKLDENFESELLKPIQRANSGDMNNQFKKAVLTVLTITERTLKRKVLNCPDEIYNLIITQMNVTDLTYLTTCSFISSLGSNLTHLEDLSSNDVDLNLCFYKLRASVYKYITSLILKISGIEDRVLYDAFKENLLVASNESAYLNNLTKQILNIFISSFNLKVKTKLRKSESHTVNFIVLPEKLLSLVILAGHLPEIVMPKSWGNNSLQLHLKSYKNVKNGYSRVTVSDFAKKEIENSQRKAFRINLEVVNLFKTLDSLPEYNEMHYNMLPFTPIPLLEKIDSDVKELREGLGDKYDTIKVEFLKLFYEKKNLKKSSHSKTFTML